MKHNFALIFIVYLGYALQCQQCGTKGTGLCKNVEDNGESVTCREGIEACWFYQQTGKNDDLQTTFESVLNINFIDIEGKVDTFRSCGPKLQERCMNQTMEGVSLV